MSSGVAIPCNATYISTTYLQELNFNMTTLCASNCSGTSSLVIKVTNLLNWPDATPQTTGTLEFYLTTSASLALSSGSTAFSTITSLTAYPISDCSVTRTPNYT